MGWSFLPAHTTTRTSGPCRGGAWHSRWNSARVRTGVRVGGDGEEGGGGEGVCPFLGGPGGVAGELADDVVGAWDGGRGGGGQ